VSSLGKELRHHLPFTTFAVVAATLAVGLLSSRRAGPWEEATFEGLHFFHIFISAVASTAVFWRYTRNVAAGIAVGVGAALLFCTLSDVVLPFVGGQLLRVPPRFEVEVFESPALAGGVGLGGAVLGLVHLRYLSIYSHSLHVIASSMASLMYLLVQGSRVWFGWAEIPVVLAVLLVAVFVPCCLSDFVMPVACTHCRFGALRRGRAPAAGGYRATAGDTAIERAGGQQDGDR
jgi:hypothetical protein